ncbi:MAG TPA: hypothetical protein VHX38_10110 [Pseudonocardiaceae bacterium]|nr:hypothetical protein [Pseudonocardiaceae bacterium]
MTQPVPEDLEVDGPPLSPADSLALIDAEQGRRARRIQVGAALTCGVWGVAYLVSFGLWYLTREAELPGLVAGVVTVVLFVGALVFSAWYGVRAGYGVRGPSRVSAAMYGCSWTISFFALTAVNVGLELRGVSGDLDILLWSGSSLLLAGALYLAGGALFHSWVDYVVGAWTMIAAAGSVFAGVPGNFLVLSLAGGGGFLAQAVFYGWLSRCGRVDGTGGAERALGVNVPTT